MNEKALKILQYKKDNPARTLAEIGVLAEVTREYVRQVLKAAGISTRAKGRPRQPGPRSVHPPRWGLPISTHANGRVGELYAAQDLLRHNYDVYDAVAWNSGCNLVIVERSGERRAWRVEVKCVTKGVRVSALFTKPRSGRYDILALVFPDGSIEYRSENGAPKLG